MSEAQTEIPAPPPQDASEEHRFPCESCGSDMRFDPRAGLLICDHCGNRQEIEQAGPWEGTISELDFARAIEARLPEADIEETRVMSCPSCGAQVEFDERIHAKECPFCATPVVTGTGPHRHIKPRALLPFGVDEREARAAMAAWLGRLWFAPGGLANYARKGRRMQGIYVPYWTFDADTRTRYTGQRGTAYYVTRTVMRDGKPRTVRQRKMRWRSVSGRVARFFDDVLVLASTSLPKQFTEGLEPWDLSALEPYRPDYLAGMRAEGYTVELAQGYDLARAKMEQVIRRDVKFDIGGDAQRISTLDTEVSDVTFKHILLPIWIAAYKFRGETFRVVINGRTGRVQGERPWSPWKIAAFVLFVVIVGGAVGYGVAVSDGF